MKGRSTFDVRRRRCAAASLAAAGLLLGTLLVADAAGLRVNTSASMPRGLWWVVASDAPLRRGDIVALCLPDTGPTREAVARGYVPAGTCPGAIEPLIKPLAAVAGDLVMVTPFGVAVDGNPVANSAALPHDSAGRALRPMPLGAYRVVPGEVWLLSGHDSRSFDSRYFGPVSVHAIRGLARPLWVFG
jgi:conjugative transfer signal peptidase TraF